MKKQVSPTMIVVAIIVVVVIVVGLAWAFLGVRKHEGMSDARLSELKAQKQQQGGGMMTPEAKMGQMKQGGGTSP